MTKEDLEFVRDNHEVNKNSYDDHATCGYNYEDGYVDALNFVLENFVRKPMKTTSCGVLLKEPSITSVNTSKINTVTMTNGTKMKL